MSVAVLPQLPWKSNLITDYSFEKQLSYFTDYFIGSAFLTVTQSKQCAAYLFCPALVVWVVGPPAGVEAVALLQLSAEHHLVGLAL